MNLLEMMECEYVPAIFTGNKINDDRANGDLYLKLVEEGKEKGFCPVLIEKNIGYYVFAEKYGRTDSKDDYAKVKDSIIQTVEKNCFSVWMGRIIYNYYLDYVEYEDEVEENLEMLNSPDDGGYDLQYFENLKKHGEEKDFIFGKFSEHWDIKYNEHVFALIPTTKPWEVLAWIPIGGFNWCPDELHQTALAKELFESYGARIMWINSCALEYYVPNALFDIEEVRKVSKMLMAADGDIYQGYDVALDEIRGSHNWYLWWD